MAESDRPHSETPSRPPGRSRVLQRSVAVVVVVAVLAAVGYRIGLAERLGIEERLGLDGPDPRRNPTAVEPPEELQLPEPAPARPVAAPVTAAEPDPALVRRALGRLLADPRLGRRVGVAVSGVDGRPVLTGGPALVTPASTLKLLTALAALEALGPEHRFRTTVVAAGRDVTLVGGGDPLLSQTPVTPDSYPAQADLTTLARKTAQRLRKDGRRSIRLTYDDTLFSGPVASPGWEPDYLPDDVVSPITALWVDQGREEPGDSERSAAPSADAAAAFAAELRRLGIKVAGPTAGAAPVGARRLATVQGAELTEVVEHVLEISDNEGAEVLARHVALSEGLPGSFEAAARAVPAVVAGLGVPVPGAVVLDGSGLARGNRLDVRTLLATLAVGAQREDPALAAMVDGLPVAGFSGSLGYRFTSDADEGLGWVRAKTGTLTGVHGLAGAVTGRDGAVMLFAMIADRVKVENTLFARDRLDQAAAALADCSCSR